MKIPVRAGREFTEHDGADSQKVLIVNETMARRLWPDRDPLGQIALNGQEEWQSLESSARAARALEQVASSEMTFQSRKTEIGVL